MFAKPVGGRGTSLVVEQLEKRPLTSSSHGGVFFLQLGGELRVGQRCTILHRDMTAEAGQAVDAGKQLLLRRSGQINQQPFGDPRRRSFGIKAAVP